MFKLSINSINKLLHHFPKIKNDVIEKINNCLDRKLFDSKRLSKMRDEHLGFTGLCAEISNEIFNIINNHYDVKIIRNGKFILDKHPRFKNINKKISSLHTWLEIDDKIVDFTASQFNPFLNHPVDELYITDKSNSRYIKYHDKHDDTIDVGLDDEVILEHYINNL